MGFRISDLVKLSKGVGAGPSRSLQISTCRRKDAATRVGFGFSRGLGFRVWAVELLDSGNLVFRICPSPYLGCHLHVQLKM